MNKYIDAEAVLKELRRLETFTPLARLGGLSAIFKAIEIVEKTPAAEVSEVVRCRDCKNWNNGDCVRLELSKPYDFCSYGITNKGV